MSVLVKCTNLQIRCIIIADIIIHSAPYIKIVKHYQRRRDDKNKITTLYKWGIERAAYTSTSEDKTVT